MDAAIDDEQRQLWNGTAGRGWVAAQVSIEAMYKPFEDLMAAAVADKPGGRVLDIGCGTGATTYAVARALGARGECLGVDISRPLIAAAEARAPMEGGTARFLCADAATQDFAPASFDALMSRFGIMFFADPVRAFAHLRRAAKPGAPLHAFAWRGAAENPFMTLAEHAAAPLLPPRPARAPDAPGPFALAEPHRVRAILESSGWSGIEIAPVDVACAFPERELAHYLRWMGPIGRILQEADAATRDIVLEKLREAFGPYVNGADVRFTAACWRIGAHA